MNHKPYRKLTPAERVAQCWPYLSRWQQVKFTALILGAAILSKINPRLALAVVRAR